MNEVAPPAASPERAATAVRREGRGVSLTEIAALVGLGAFAGFVASSVFAMHMDAGQEARLAAGYPTFAVIDARALLDRHIDDLSARGLTGEALERATREWSRELEDGLEALAAGRNVVVLDRNAVVIGAPDITEALADALR